MGEFTTGGLALEFQDFKKLSKLLKDVAPDLRKQLYKDVSKAGREVITVAKSLVGEAPMSGWTKTPKDPVGWATKRGRTPSRGGAGWPAFEPAAVKRGMTSRATKPKGAKYGGILYLVNKDAAGAIAEVAGRNNPSGTAPQGKQFMDNLNANYGEPSRLIWEAFDRVGRSKVEDGVREAIRRTEIELERRLNGEGA